MTSFSKNKHLIILFFLIYLTTQIVATTWLNQFNYDFWIIWINVLIIVDILIKILIIKILNLKVLSLTILFIFLSYIFQFGHLLLLLFRYDFKFMTSGINIYSLNIYKQAVQYALVGITSLFIGSILAYKRIKITHSTEKTLFSFKQNKESIKLIGLTLFIISFPVNLYILVNRFFILLRYGKYDAIFDFDVSYILVLFSDLMYIGVFLLLVYYKNKEKVSKSILIILVGYIALSMFTGFRGKAMALIISFLYLYNLAVNKFSPKKMIKIIFLGIMTLFLLMIIRNTRKYGLDLQMVPDIIRNSNNIFAETLEEFGYTINVTCEIINQVSNGNATHEYFKVFLSEIASIVPFISRLFPEKELGVMVVKKLGVWNMGTSYIADIYYYFGYYGWAILMFLGFFIRKIENKLELYVVKKDYLLISSFVLWIIGILLMVRSPFSLGLRNLIWSYVLIKIIELIYFNLPKKLSSGIEKL